jgi:glutaminyl-tRNA synthetase
MATDLRGLLGDRSLTDLTFGGEGLGALVALVESGRLTRRAAKDVLARMVLDGGDPESLMTEMGLEVMGVGDALGAAVDEVLGRWPDKVDAYRAGNKNLLGMFVGQVMKATGGAADPHAVRSFLSERLDS